ncbi:hypothetical protein DZF91_05015 [Actinomadura logoneensis]|uniref:Uncharacterized protein n=1 Tax=Actinomadura logoneensis TaxID=2293572 RepID=A0A372JRX7_9ACTN|nr:hypothetical protein DZF91_05015 [Actinomadura logoneensis]
MVVGVPDRDPADAVRIVVRGQSGPVHHLAGDLRPLLIAQDRVLWRRSYRHMPHRPRMVPIPENLHRQRQQFSQVPEVPASVLSLRRL